MNVLDLFSGIGGFSLGLERTGGFKTIAFCEINDFCRKVLKKNWPEIPVFEDIKKLKKEDINGTVDVICGGFPCQPFSVAGKRRGAEDDRFLWPEMLRVIKDFQPRWIIGENVAGFVSMELDATLAGLEAAGYTSETFILPAVAVDAPHRRDRCFIVSYSDSVQRESGGRRTEKERRSSERISAYSDAAKIRRFRAPLSDFTRESCSDYAQIRPDDDARFCVWTNESGFRRVANGIPNRVDRIAALGNAVVPQIITEIGYAILEVEKNEHA